MNSIQVHTNPLEPATNDCTQWVTINTSDETQQQLKKRNQIFFGQAHGIYPAIPNFLEKVNWEENTFTLELILDGGYTNSEMSEFTTNMVKHRERNTHMSGIKDTIIITDWTDKMKV